MSAGVEVPDEVSASISGQRAGERTVHVHRDGYADPDRLLHDLVDVLAIDGQALRVTSRLRGWCRALAKALEGGRP